MIKIKPLNGEEPFYLNAELIESITQCQGNTSQIRLTNGRVYFSIESPEQLANRITLYQKSSELAKPRPLQI